MVEPSPAGHPVDGPLGPEIRPRGNRTHRGRAGHRGLGKLRVRPGNSALLARVRRGDSLHRQNAPRGGSRGAGLAPVCLGRDGSARVAAREPGRLGPGGRTRELRDPDRGLATPERGPERGLGAAPHGSPPSSPPQVGALLALLRPRVNQLDRPVWKGRPGCTGSGSC